MTTRANGRAGQDRDSDPSEDGPEVPWQFLRAVLLFWALFGLAWWAVAR